MCQKDIHYYATRCIAKEAGYSDEDAELIAWANVQTDTCKGFGFHTQVNPITYLWSKAGTYFHFLPGDDPERPEMTTANCWIAQKLVKMATSPIEKGIALHSLQDTWSHQNFYPKCTRENNTQQWAQWWPHYGHSAMIKTPDILAADWYDGRIGQNVINRERFRYALRATYTALAENGANVGAWSQSSEAMKILSDRALDYEARKAAWATASGIRASASKTDKEMWAEHIAEFKAAAKRQKQVVQEWLRIKK